MRFVSLLPVFYRCRTCFASDACRMQKPRKNRRERGPLFQNLQNPACKVGSDAADCFVAFFRGFEEWSSLAHCCSRAFCKMLTISFRRQYPKRFPAPDFLKNSQPQILQKIFPAPDVSGASEASGGRGSFGNGRQAAKKH